MPRMMIVEVWPRGYAHEDGTKRLLIEEGADPAAAASRAYGALATVSSVRPVRDLPAQPMSEADERYARSMSERDNS